MNTGTRVRVHTHTLTRSIYHSLSKPACTLSLSFSVGVCDLFAVRGRKNTQIHQWLKFLIVQKREKKSWESFFFSRILWLPNWKLRLCSSTWIFPPLLWKCQFFFLFSSSKWFNFNMAVDCLSYHQQHAKVA